ncbi:MAG: hypothetical protein H7Y28_02695 [Rhodoferax sp.]|nr:hypothetical protein [Rhodoferax sp.]
MKYLVILVLVFLVAWQWRNARAKHIKTRSMRDKAPQSPVDMVACAHCGVHLPARDAVQGSAGQYCDAHHRAAAER